VKVVIYTLTLSVVVALSAYTLLFGEANAEVPQKDVKVHQKEGEVVVKKRDGSYQVRKVGREDPARAAKKIKETEPDAEEAGPNMGVPVGQEGLLQPSPGGILNPILGGTLPSDPLVADQPNLTASPMRFDAAWAGAGGSKGDGQVVGVVDTGFQQDHPDLASKVFSQYDFVGEDAEADPYNYHGSAVSSVAAAETNDNEGMAGAGWNAMFSHAKACTDLCYTADTAPAVDWLVGQGVKQINLSFGAIGYGYGTNDDPVLKKAISDAQAADVLVVSIMGNDGVETDNFGPGCWPDVLAVGGTNRDATDWYPKSNWGPCLDVAAPSQDILSAMKPSDCSGNLYCNATGTSFGAPHVAAVSALVREKYPSMTQTQVAERIVKVAKARSFPGYPPGGSVKVLSAKCAVKPGSTGC